MGKFDPYHKWLGISPRDQPPNHYRLLGIDQYESDAEVIEAAADRRMAFLHQYVTGDHVADAQRLLNELAAARICLMDPKRRRAYDKQLENASNLPRPERHTQLDGRIVLLSAAACVVVVIVGASALFLLDGDRGKTEIVAGGTESAPDVKMGVPPTRDPEFVDEAKIPNTSITADENADRSPSPEVVETGSVPTHVEKSPEVNGLGVAGPHLTEPEIKEPSQDQQTAVAHAPVEAPVEANASGAKLTIPDEQSQIAARQDNRLLFESDFRRIGRRDAKVDLAQKLLEQGRQPELDPAQRYVSLRDAKEFADAATNDELAEESMIELDRWFDIDVYEMKLDTLRRQFKLASQPQAYSKLAKQALQTIDEASRARRYESALRIGVLSQTIAGKSKNPRLLVESRIAHDRAARLRDESNKVMKAESILQRQPRDRRASSTVGQYLCFVENDWERGTAHLTNSDDPALKSAADLEQRHADPLLIGNAWWELAESSSGDIQRHYQQRARHWYEQALAVAANSDKVFLASRVQSAIDNPFPHEKLFLAELPEYDLVLGPWGFTKNGQKGAYHPDLIVVNGIHAEHGLGMHPPGGGQSVAKYKLAGKFGTFIGAAVLASEPGSSGESPVTFRVIGDGRVLWESKPAQLAQQVEDFAIDVRDVGTLVLQTDCPGGANNCHACWIDPYLIRASGLVPRRK